MMPQEKCNNCGSFSLIDIPGGRRFCQRCRSHQVVATPFQTEERTMLSAGLNKVIVKIIDNPKMSPGGIEIPDIVKQHEPQKRGVRAMVLTCCWGEDMQVPEGLGKGARVYVPLIGGIKLLHEGEDVVVYPIEDILAVVS